MSPQTGLDTTQAQRRLHTYGKNAISPPKSNVLRKVLEWLLGGFGSLLLAASIVCFVAWYVCSTSYYHIPLTTGPLVPDRKPLGEPNPQASNFALAVVLLIVLFLQAAFNAWQDFSTSRVMSSIKGMLPSDVLVLREGNQVSLPASELVNGDLIYVGLGEKVPADLRLIEVSGDLRFDRSILTGEVSSFSLTLLRRLTSHHTQSEPIAGRVNMTDKNFLEVGRTLAWLAVTCLPCVAEQEHRLARHALCERLGHGSRYSDGRQHGLVSTANTPSCRWS